MAPSKLSPAERAFRKREAARLRQQRCRERKRQANLKKKMEEEAAKKQKLLNPSSNASTTATVISNSASNSPELPLKKLREEEPSLIQRQSSTELPLPPLIPAQIDSQLPHHVHQHHQQHHPRAYHHRQRRYSFSHHQQQPQSLSVISACESFPSITSEPTPSSDEYFDDPVHQYSHNHHSHVNVVPNMVEPLSSTPNPAKTSSTTKATPMRPLPQMKSYSPHSVAVNFDSIVAHRSPSTIRMIVKQAPSPPLLTINEEEMEHSHHSPNHYLHKHHQHQPPPPPSHGQSRSYLFQYSQSHNQQQQQKQQQVPAHLHHPMTTTTTGSGISQSQGQRQGGRHYSSLPIQKRPLRPQVQTNCDPVGQGKIQVPGPPKQTLPPPPSPSSSNIELDAVQAMLSLKSDGGSDAGSEATPATQEPPVTPKSRSSPVREHEYEREVEREREHAAAVKVTSSTPSPMREGSHLRYDQGMVQSQATHHRQQHSQQHVPLHSHSHSHAHAHSHSPVRSSPGQGPYWQHSRPYPQPQPQPHSRPQLSVSHHGEDAARGMYMERMMRAEAMMQTQESYNSPGVYIYYREG